MNIEQYCKKTNSKLLDNCSPESIADTIFKSDPKPPCSFQLLAYQEGADSTQGKIRGRGIDQGSLHFIFYKESWLNWPRLFCFEWHDIELSF